MWEEDGGQSEILPKAGSDFSLIQSVDISDIFSRGEPGLGAALLLV